MKNPAEEVTRYGDLTEKREVMLAMPRSSVIKLTKKQREVLGRLGIEKKFNLLNWSSRIVVGLMFTAAAVSGVALGDHIINHPSQYETRLAAESALDEFDLQGHPLEAITPAKKAYIDKVNAAIASETKKPSWTKDSVITAIGAVPVPVEVSQALPSDFFRKKNAENIYGMLLEKRGSSNVYNKTYNNEMEENNPWASALLLGMLIPGALGGLSGFLRYRLTKKTVYQVGEDIINEYEGRSKREMTLLKEASLARKNGELANESAALNLLNDLYIEQYKLQGSLSRNPEVKVTQEALERSRRLEELAKDSYGNITPKVIEPNALKTVEHTNADVSTVQDAIRSRESNLGMARFGELS